MTEIKLYKNTTKGLKIIIMCLPFIAIGLLYRTLNPMETTNYIIYWAGTCLFGLGVLVGLFHTFDRRPQIIISEQGIWDRTTKQDIVKWEQIIEAYPLEIFKQEFISIVTDNTFVFKKKPYKWVEKINKEFGAQNLNLHIGQINIDQIELTNFINRLSKENIEERRRLIKSFKFKKIYFSVNDFNKILFYIIISLTLLILSLSSITALWIVIGLTGISGIIARWDPDNLTIKKYSGIGTWFGLINILLLLGTMQIYNNITDEVGEKLIIEIEEFRNHNSKYPTDIKSIKKEVDLNFIERYFANQIDYKTFDKDYELETIMLFGKRRKYDKNNNEWR